VPSRRQRRMRRRWVRLPSPPPSVIRKVRRAHHIGFFMLLLFGVGVLIGAGFALLSNLLLGEPLSWP
jgi:hypothetical protein